MNTLRASLIAHTRPAKGALRPEGRISNPSYYGVQGLPFPIPDIHAPKRLTLFFYNQGARVIALAHRPLTETESLRIKDSKNPLTRDEMERGLVFDGFLAFACAIRVDTPDVVKALLASSHTVMMATGDATLTGLHVANEVGIARGGLEGALMLVLSHDGTVGRADQSDTTAADTKSADTTNSPVNPKLKWVSAKTDLGTEAPMLEIPYVCDGKSIVNLSKQYSLCVTGETLNAALAEDRDGGLWDFLDSVVIFARMSPDDKERVLKRLKQQGRHTFMCGDGANDVGALKQVRISQLPHSAD